MKGDKLSKLTPDFDVQGHILSKVARQERDAL